MSENSTKIQKLNQVIMLDEVLEICEQYYDKKISRDDLQKWAKKIIIVNYLPIKTKHAIISYLLLSQSLNTVEQNELIITQLEMNKFWYCLLKYTNIQIEGYENLLSINNYDIIFSVIGDWILQFCFADYNRICKMIDDTINISNIKNLMESMAMFDNRTLKQYTKEIKEQIKYLENHKDELKDLAAIMTYNNTDLMKLFNQIRNEDMKEIKSEE